MTDQPYLERLKQCSLSDLHQEEQLESSAMSNMIVRSNIDESLKNISLDLFNMKYSAIKAWKNLNSLSILDLNEEKNEKLLSSIRYTEDIILNSVVVLNNVKSLFNQDEIKCSDKEFIMKPSEDCQDVKPSRVLNEVYSIFHHTFIRA